MACPEPVERVVVYQGRSAPVVLKKTIGSKKFIVATLLELVFQEIA